MKREFVSENGADFNGVLPKMSPLNPKYLPTKRSVFEKLSAFVERFKGIGGYVIDRPARFDRPTEEPMENPVGPFATL